MIHYYYAHNRNIGDYYSGKGIRLLMGRRGKRVQFELNLRDAGQHLSCGKSPDLIIIGGGGLLMDFFEPFWEALLEWHEKTRRPYVLWGIGYCESKLRESKAATGLIDEVIRHADLAGLRDQRTYDAFRHHTNASLVPCPSMYAVQKDAQAWGKTRKTSPHLLQVDHPDLLRELSMRVGRPVRNEIYVTCARAAAALNMSHRRITNVTVEKYGRVRRISIAMCDRLGLGPGAHQPIEEVWMTINGEVAKRYMLKQYLNARYIVTSRLHGAIIGFSLGKKVVAISGDWKIDSFFASLGLSDWVSEDPSHLPMLLSRIEEQPSTTDMIAGMIARNRDFATKVRALLPPRS